MADQGQGHYAVLGLSTTATAADIKAAYNSLVLIHHPDKGGNQETFIKIQQAYEVLRDSESREAYDQEQQRGEARKAQEKTKTKKAEDKQKTRKETAAAGKGERPEREPRDQPTPKEHRDRDERHKQPNARDGHKQQQQQRRGQPDSFFADDSFFSDDKFTFKVFNDFQGFAAGFQFPPDKDRNAPHTKTRAKDQSPQSPKNASPETHRKNVPFKRTEEAARNQRDPSCPKGCGENSIPRNRNEPHPQLPETTFEALLDGATRHSEQFNHAFHKLHATVGSHSSKYSDLWCHLQHVKDLLSKRILSVKLAQQDHAVLELRQGLKEGTLKPRKDIISSLSSKIDYDHGCLKDTGDLMFKAYESAKELRNPTKKRQGFIDSECPGCTVGIDSAMRVLQNHLTRSLFKQ